MKSSLPQSLRFRTLSTFETLLIFLAISGQALAQQQVTTTAIPPRLEIEALPGATLQETLRVKNDSDQEIAYKVEFVDFIVNDNQGTPIAVSETVSGRWNLSSWLQVTPKQVLLKPGDTATLDLLVALPDDALPGGHYAMVTYVPVTEGNINQTGSAIFPKTGTLVYLNVIGDVVEAINLKQLSVPNKFAHYGPIDILAEIENLGDIHLRPTGKVTVQNMLKDTVAAFALEEKNIFPFASRTYEFQVPGKWRLGKYAVRLEAVAGNKNIPVNGLIYLWIMPVKELVVIAIVLIIVAILIKRRRHQPPTATGNLDIYPEDPTTTPPVA